MIGALQLSCLILYEVVAASVLGAFKKMSPKIKKIYLIIALMPLACMTMFHSACIGNDTGVYIDLFDQIQRSSFGFVLNNTRYEKGYLIYNYILTRLFDSYQSLFVVTGAFVYLSLSRWLIKWSEAPGLFVCLIVEMLVIDSWMSVLRQSIAMAILFWAYDFMIEKKLIKFLLVIALASSFHKVAIAFVIIYPVVHFLDNRNKSHKFEVLIIIGSVIVGTLFEKILTIAVSIFPIYSYYLNGIYANGEPRVSIYLRILIFALMFWLPRWTEKRRAKSNDDLKSKSLYRFSILNIAFMLMANQATILMRLASLYSIYAILDYSENVSRLQAYNNRKIVVLFSVVLFGIYSIVITVLKTPEWQTTYPFFWFWQS